MSVSGSGLKQFGLPTKQATEAEGTWLKRVNEKKQMTINKIFFIVNFLKLLKRVIQVNTHNGLK
jgi:hypothetical protein